MYVVKNQAKMEINVAKLRELPQINWLVPYAWMSKMTNEDLHKWENEAIVEEFNRIKEEKRPISADPGDQEHKFMEEAKARVRDLARMLEIDYLKINP
jgi:hypothetical protein